MPGWSWLTSCSFGPPDEYANAASRASAARLIDVKACKPLGLLLDDLDSRDRGCARATAAKADERLDRLRLSLEDRLHRPVRPVAYPAGDGASLCRPHDGEPEPDALNAPVHDDPAPDSQPLTPVEADYSSVWLTLCPNREDEARRRRTGNERAAPPDLAVMDTQIPLSRDGLDSIAMRQRAEKATGGR